MREPLLLARGAASPIRGRPFGSLIRVIPWASAQVSRRLAFCSYDRAPRRGHEDDAARSRRRPHALRRARRTGNSMIRLLLCDDSADARAALRAMLHDQGEIEIVGEAADGEQAVALAVELAPHVGLMDVAMPILHGVA